MADPILPTVASLITPAIDAIVAARPESLQFFNAPSSRWLDLPAMWRAQILLNLARLGDECNSARLATATGNSLRQLAASEFNTVLPSSPQQALGTLTLARQLGNAIAITGATNTNPIVISTQTPHGLSQVPGANQGVVILNVGGNTAANGTWVGASAPVVFSPTSFSIPVAGSGSYTSGGTSQSVPQAGVIRAGTKFVKIANPTGYPIPVAAATYTSTSTVYAPAGNGNPLQFITVPVLADSGGAGANVPSWLNATFNSSGQLSPVTPLINPAQALFDPTIYTYSCTAAGGSSGLPDPVLVAACRAYAIGQFGPTDGALLAGALQTQSVRYYAAVPASSAIPYATIIIADESWATDARWQASVQQELNDTWVGFGGRVRIGSVLNQQIVVTPTIVLKSTDDLAFTDSITANVAAAAESYFNDRPDWYRWRSATLQALITASDDRILQCTGLSVTDPASGNTIAEASNVFTGTFAGSVAVHMMLTDSNVQPIYLPPS